MDLETAQVAARHFVRLPIDRQQRGVTAKSTYRGGVTQFKQTSGGPRKQQQQHESPPARRLRSTGNSEGRHRPKKPSSLTLGNEE